MDKADRNYIEALIVMAQRATITARDVAGLHGLSDVSERLSWALDFQQAAKERLLPGEPNPDGTTGPEHVTSEGIELGPPKG